jgi:hypothetical protein
VTRNSTLNGQLGTCARPASLSHRLNAVIDPIYPITGSTCLAMCLSVSFDSRPGCAPSRLTTPRRRAGRRSLPTAFHHDSEASVSYPAMLFSAEAYLSTPFHRVPSVGRRVLRASRPCRIEHRIHLRFRPRAMQQPGEEYRLSRIHNQPNCDHCGATLASTPQHMLWAEAAMREERVSVHCRTHIQQY